PAVGGVISQRAAHPNENQQTSQTRREDALQELQGGWLTRRKPRPPGGFRGDRAEAARLRGNSSSSPAVGETRPRPPPGARRERRRDLRRDDDVHFRKPGVALRPGAERFILGEPGTPRRPAGES